MFTNNIGGPFISPNMAYNPMITNSPIMNMANPAMMGMRGPEFMGNTSMFGVPRSGGLLSSLFGRNTTGNLLTGARSFNFGNLLTNTSKALGVVKDAIPIVKEVGPMMGNMRSILKLASVFKDETDINTSPISNNNTEISNTITNTNENDTRTTSTTITESNNNEPNFFL